MAAIKVPPLGESITEATISRWLKQEGDSVSPGDTLVELETDKITVEVPSMSSGVLTKRAHAEGDVVKVDDLLAEIDEAAAGSAGTAGTAGTRDSGLGKTAAPAAQQPAPQQSDVRASPAAQRVAAETGADLSKVQGTGRGGVISKPDVIEQQQQSKPPAAPAVPSPE